ncbi:MAG: hypothetical protein K2W96_14665 [Gemmataceae bacterium]|nr:hypothetical protein [Gemmataceae bacterium]
MGLAFMPDGKGLLTADRDGTVMLTKGKGRRKLAGQGPILALALSPDGKRFALARADGLLVVKPLADLK